MRGLVLDLFAGPGGWSHALAVLGVRDVGLEWDEWACKTRAAARLQTIRTDVALYPVHPFVGRTWGVLASPPCQAWSMAGKRLGLLDQPLVHTAVADLATGRDTRERLLASCRDARSLLAAEPMRYLRALNVVGEPEWVAMEEVPDVLPLWRQYAAILRSWGFSVWTGILNAADYGVPQTRKRAILLASRTRTAEPPPPTHARHPEPESLFGPGREKWVSMAQALGWGATDQPVPTVCAGEVPAAAPNPSRPVPGKRSPTPATAAHGHHDRTVSSHHPAGRRGAAPTRAARRPVSRRASARRTAGPGPCGATTRPTPPSGRFPSRRGRCSSGTARMSAPGLPNPQPPSRRRRGQSLSRTRSGSPPPRPPSCRRSRRTTPGQATRASSSRRSATPSPLLAGHLLAPHLGVPLNPDDFTLAA